MTSDTRVLEDVRETVKDAGAIEVPPWLAVVAALCGARPTGMQATFEWLESNRALIEAEYQRGRVSPLAAGAISSDLEFVPELGDLDRSLNDRWLRDKLVFGQLVGSVTFNQAVVFAISGRMISVEESTLLEQFAVAAITVDRGAWPMAAARRVAGHGGGIAAAVIAGSAMMGSAYLGGLAVANCAKFLLSVAEADDRGVSVRDTVADLIARKVRVAGFGRPVVGPDERALVLFSLLERSGRTGGKYVSLLCRTEREFLSQRGLRTNAAGWAASLLLDLGLSPNEIHALSNHWMTASVFAQAAFSDARFLEVSSAAP